MRLSNIEGIFWPNSTSDIKISPLITEQRESVNSYSENVFHSRILRAAVSQFFAFRQLSQSQRWNYAVRNFARESAVISLNELHIVYRHSSRNQALILRARFIEVEHFCTFPWHLFVSDAPTVNKKKNSRYARYLLVFLLHFFGHLQFTKEKSGKKMYRQKIRIIRKKKHKKTISHSRNQIWTLIF